MATVGTRTVQTQAGAIRVQTDRSEILPGVYSTMSGFLYCATCKSGWCNHIETVIKEGRDSKSIWNDFTWHDQQRLLVPILPTDWYLFATALLVPNGDDFEVKVGGGRDSTLPDVYDVGLISKGDGRAQIRMMIIDWLKMNAYPSSAGLCISGIHTMGTEARVATQYQTDQRALLAHTFCFKWYKKCAICTQVEGPKPSAFNRNLIPEV